MAVADRANLAILVTKSALLAQFSRNNGNFETKFEYGNGKIQSMDIDSVTAAPVLLNIANMSNKATAIGLASSIRLNSVNIANKKMSS